MSRWVDPCLNFLPDQLLLSYIVILSFDFDFDILPAAADNRLEATPARQAFFLAVQDPRAMDLLDKLAIYVPEFGWIWPKMTWLHVFCAFLTWWRNAGISWNFCIISFYQCPVCPNVQYFSSLSVLFVQGLHGFSHRPDSRRQLLSKDRKGSHLFWGCGCHLAHHACKAGLAKGHLGLWLSSTNGMSHVVLFDSSLDAPLAQSSGLPNGFEFWITCTRRSLTMFEEFGN